MFLLVTVLVEFLWTGVDAHGRLIEPPSRASAWRYGFNTPANYNDHELFCGGFTRQWVQNGGKCGVCGDPWDSKTPRAHEYGGTYGQGVIVRNYDPQSSITIRVELTASHYGYFEFAICPDFKTATQTCLDKNVLKLVKPQDDVEHLGYRYFPKDGNKIYEMKYKLPKATCKHCLLQWRYIAGNNWGNCPNGTGAVGCGPQEEFRACADISVGEKGTFANVPEIEEPATTLVPVIPTPEDTSYSPFAAILISIVTFLAISLVLFLLYFHYYQVGRQIKVWASSKWNRTEDRNRNGFDSSGTKAETNEVPVAPPRVKKCKVLVEEGMHEVDLTDVSTA